MKFLRVWMMRAIAGARIKTDTIEASTLAHLLRQRMLLVRRATRVKNRLHFFDREVSDP